MKFYFPKGSLDLSPRQNGKLATITLYPETQSRSGDPIKILVAKEIEDPTSGQQYDLGMVGKEKSMPMLYPARKSDNRILLLAEVGQPKHRHDGRVDKEETTAKLLKYSCGGGAWGSGCAFLALLDQGQKVVSSGHSRPMVWENKGGELVFTQYDSQAEYDLVYKQTEDEIEFI